jgi:hypothetical protein
MSFKCQMCDEVQGHGIKPIKVVTESEDKYYPPQLLKPKKVEEDEFIDEDNDGFESTPKKRYGREGHGWQIVKEKNICRKCAVKMEV